MLQSDFAPRLRPMGRSAMAHLGLAESLAQSGYELEAIGELDAALAENPELADAHFFKGALLVRRSQIDAAIEHLRTAIRLDDEQMRARLVLAWVYLDQDELDEALSTVAPVLDDDEHGAAAYELRGDILYEMQRQDEAAEAYRHSVERNPQLTGPRMRLGRLLSEAGEQEEAIAQLLGAARLNPTQPMSRVYLGDALRAQGHVEQAIAEYEAATQLDDRLGTPYARLGEVYLERGEISEAISVLKAAIKVDTKQFDSYVNLGRAYVKLDQYQEAAEMLRAAIELDDREPVAPRLLAEVEAALARQQETNPDEASSGTDADSPPPSP